MVIRSASTWQGWQKSVRPLITGTLPYWARASTSSWPKVRIIMPSTYRDSTRAVSCTGSPRPIWEPSAPSTTAYPPSWLMPTSKLTRVRVEDFSKIMPKHLPFRAGCSMPCFVSYFSWSARFRMSRISSPVRSSSFSKCFMAIYPFSLILPFQEHAI